MQRPQITLKIAITLDGFLAQTNGQSQWITDEQAREQGHRLRADHQALLTGCGTITTDNPKLNFRLEKGRSPTLVLLDSYGIIPPNSQCFDFSNERQVIWIVGSNCQTETLEKPQGVEMVQSPTIRPELEWLLPLLFEKYQIKTLLVEAGTHINTSFIQAKLFDKICGFIAPKILGSGLPLCQSLNTNLNHAPSLQILKIERIGQDIFFEAIPQVASDIAQ